MAREIVRREIICAGDAHCALYANRLWLPIQTSYHLQVSALRLRGKRVGEIALFEGRGRPSRVLDLFVKTWTRILAHNLDVVLIAVAPDDARFYRRFMFQPTGWPRRPWAFADLAPVEVLMLDVHDAPLRATPALWKRFMEAAR